jgi:hypothetical protein
MDCAFGTLWNHHLIIYPELNSGLKQSVPLALFLQAIAELL